MKQIIGAFLIVLLAGPVLAQPGQPEIPGWKSGRHKWQLLELCRHHPRHAECLHE
jgi:hypothetical protein